MSAGSRTAWVAAGTVAAVAAIAMATLQVVGFVASDEELRRDVVTAAIRSVDVRSGAGRLRLRRSTDGTTVLEQRLVSGLATPRSTFHVDGDRLVVATRCRRFAAGRCAVDLTLAVPDGAKVTARSSGGGIRSTDVDGALHLRSSGGGITVTGGRGALDLEASGGGVRVDGTAATRVMADASGGGVRLSFAVPPDEVVADSSGGGVTVEVPVDQTGYRVDARSSGGGTDVDVRTDPLGDRRITIRSSGGGVRVRYPDQQ